MSAISNTNNSTLPQDSSGVDSYGFQRENGFDYKLYEAFESEYKVVIDRRNKRWEKVMKKEKYKHNYKTKRFCRKGIPHHLRSQVWLDVSGAKKKMQSQPGYYQKHLTTPCSNSKVESDLKEAIDIDLSRTFPDNVHFQSETSGDKKKSLRNVLIAFGRHNPDVSYCQGMNYIAALLLIIVQDEEKSFWLLCALIDEVLPAYYANRMVALRVDVQVFAELVRLRYPDIDQTLKTTDTTWMLIASKWFICLFIDVLPIETVLRIWDCLFFEGSKILFRVALGLASDKSSAIAKCRSLPDVVEAFRPIRNESSTLSCHTFMQKCFSIPLTRKEITQLRERYTEVVLADDEDYKRKKADS